jgi:pimeloyl-ACP methyl ester carboxylesterase
MPRLTANGIDIEYATHGRAGDPPLLLICGFTQQMVRWPNRLIDALVAGGRQVISFDNRDIGLSTELAGHAPLPVKDIVNAISGGCPPQHLVAYLLDDMAADAAGLLDALGIDKADVMGNSMGGMIAQLVALNHPEKVRKLIPVMTTSGAADLPRADPAAQTALTAVPKSRAPEDIAEVAVLSNRAIGSVDGVRATDAEVRARAMSDAARSDRPLGVARQYNAIVAQPRWHERLGDVHRPTLVLHGAVDPLIKPACGEDIARRIPGARFKALANWGHDLPDAMMGELAAHVNAFLDEA